MSPVKLVRAKITFDDGIARRLVNEMVVEHRLFGHAIDFAANHDAECPEETDTTPRVGWVGDAIFWVDIEERLILRWKISNIEDAVEIAIAQNAS